jgi:DNA-binding NarL/FixJ family response regulator
VLALVAVGYTNDQAARRLGISPRTIRKHLEAIFAKAHVQSRAAAVACWLHQKAGPKSTAQSSIAVGDHRHASDMER